MVALALALDRHTEDRLLGDLVEHGHTVVARAATAADLLGSLDAAGARGPTDTVALVGAARLTLTAELINGCDAKGVRVIALAATDLDRRYAASLGLYEVIGADARWPDIEAMLVGGIAVPLRVGDQSRATGALRRGSVIGVWGPAGAPGRTTLAINIAAEIAAAGHTVVLADVDTYSGSVAPSLGMLDEAPGFAAACRLAGSDSLRQSEFERIAQRYNSPQGAFWVLTGLGRPSRWPELSSERVTKTIQALRLWADYVVLDTGFSLESDEEISSDLFAPRRNAATVSALREADHVVACGLADPVGMARFLRAWVELADVLTTERVSVVMNRVRASAVGLDPNGQVVSTLRRFGNIDGAVLVPNDQQATDAAVLTGRTLRDAAPKSPARASIRRFVQSELLAETAPVTGHRRTVSWRRRAAATS
ncbi:AAA family ATPase [Glaciibacter sp. 2TAF33]|uniref:AAA family ATPase n=1 Tax=Glaciibacter sp. 2TAF33 TaxID=3233015 RepID=UPI003F900B94